MSERSFKWKDTLKSASRMNRMIGPKGALPDKFSPAREGSMEVDKLFNGSRSRLHASMEAMNLSREDSSIDKGHHRPALPKTPMLDKMNSIQNKLLVSGSLNGPILQTSSLIHEHQKHANRSTPAVNPSQLTEIRKEYLAFKQNVLRELDRQREMVEKFVKEIVLTVEFELEKLRGQKGADEAVATTTSLPPAADSSAVRTLEEWKSKLSKVNIAAPAAPEDSSPPAIPKDLCSEAAQGRQCEVLPPQMPVDMSVFLSTFERLKRQMGEMDRLLLEPGGSAPRVSPGK